MTDFFGARWLIIGAVGCCVLAGALVPALSGTHADATVARPVTAAHAVAAARSVTAAHGAVKAPERIFAAFSDNVADIDPATGVVKVTSEHLPLSEESPSLIAAAPDNKTVYVVIQNADKVVPYNVTTGQPEKAIRAGSRAQSALMAPDGTLYVGGKGGTITPISTATNRAGPPIDVHGDASSMVITPNGRTLYVADSDTGLVVPVSTATNRPGTPIRVGRGGTPDSLAMMPNGKTLYVADGSGAIIPISTATGRKGSPFEVSGQPQAIAITPNGKTAYVVRGGSLSAVSPLNLATHHVGKSIPVPMLAEWIVISPDGKTAYVGYLGGPVIPINTATNVKGAYFGWSQLTMAMAFGPTGSTAYTCGWHGVIPVSTRTYALGSALYAPTSPYRLPCWAMVVTP